MDAGKITTTTVPLATNHGPNEPYSNIQNENKIFVAFVGCGYCHICSCYCYGRHCYSIAVGYCKILCVKHLCDVKTTDLILHMPHVLYSNVESFLKHSCLLCAHLLWVFEFIKQIDRGYILFFSFRFFYSLFFSFFLSHKSLLLLILYMDIHQRKVFVAVHKAAIDHFTVAIYVEMITAYRFNSA